MKYKNVELHAHSDAYYNGSGDGAQTVVEMLDTASRNGATAMAITDHGNAVNWIDFYNYARGGEVDHTSLKKKGLNLVKPILGIEAYVALDENIYCDGDESRNKTIRQHFIVLVKDYIGMQQVSRFISETNRHIDSSGRPVATFSMLKKFFGGEPGAKNEAGHVIAMSACIAGVIATPFLFNRRIEKEIARQEKLIDKLMDSIDDEFVSAVKFVEGVNREIEALETEKNDLKPIADKKFGAAKKAAKKIEDDAERSFMEEQIVLEEKETENAKERRKEIAAIVKAKKADPEYKEAKKLAKKVSDKQEKIDAHRNAIDVLSKNRKSEDELWSAAEQAALSYRDIFGDDFYLELQYHGIEIEAEVMPKIAQLAKTLGIKTTITNDVHIATKDDVLTREVIVNSARLGGEWSSAIEGDDELYFKTEEEKREMLSQILPVEIIDESIANVNAIAEQCNLETLSEEKHYPEYKNADEKLRELAITGHTVVETLDGRQMELDFKNGGIEKRYGKEKWEKLGLQKRLDYELSVIKQMGFGSYFLFIDDVLLKCKNATGDIGPGRGSGAGSIVCYLSGITEIDPIEHGLLFERFLNPDRVSMPDIDSDFGFRGRNLAVEYANATFGSRAVAGIMTKGKFGARSSLTYAPKLWAKKNGLNLKTYEVLGKKLRSFIKDDHDPLSAIADDVKALNDADANAIYDFALRLEGKISSYGQHAAGTIVIMSGDVEDFIPLMSCKDRTGADKMVIQADMVAAEAQLGFIKFDFLGLKNMNVIVRARELVNERYGVDVDFYNLRLDDSEVYEKIFQTADTDFVFQFESDGMKRMLLRLHPERFGDLVLAVSVYRPGPMQFIDDIIACKDGKKTSPIVERVPVLKDVLAETYGFPVYQEQVMRIMTICAGFTPGEADNVRRMMSKKKVDKLAETRPKFIEGCQGNGINSDDANWLFDQLMPFAEYGFNKSHAAAYSDVSYITAWFKTHYPKEYLCAAMLEQGDKTMQFQSNCKNYGIEIRPVSVNGSDEDYSVVSDTAVRIGLSAIKGLKNGSSVIEKERKKNGKFENIKDFLSRCGLKSNEFEACILSGACDSLIDNREKAVVTAKAFLSTYASYKKAVEKAGEAALKIDGTKKAKDALEKCKKNVSDLQNDMNNITFESAFSTPDNVKLAYEMEYLGMFLSGSPLDAFDLTNEKYCQISDAVEGDRVGTIGIVSKSRTFLTKNGDKMASFTLLTKDSDFIEVVVFPRDFSQINFELEDNMVVEVFGELQSRDEDLQIVASCVNKMEVSYKTIRILANGFDEAIRIAQILVPYKNKNGLTVSFLCLGQVRDANFKVSSAALEALSDVEYQIA